MPPHERAPRGPRRSTPRVEVDPDAVATRISDLEALLVSPGWAWLCVEANKLYGQRVFTDQVEHLARSEPMDEVGPKTVALVAARVAAGRLINLPSETLAELKRKVATQSPLTTRPSFGPDVESSNREA